jgi:hypothetical protein
MIKKTDIQSEQKEIKDLTQHELNIIYSLVRIGDWADSEIGRVYKLSAEDVRRVFDNYVDLLEVAEKNPPVQEQLLQDQSQESVEKPRKRRSDARFATPAERQANYRARLKEKRHAELQQPPQSSDTDSQPTDSELIRNGPSPPEAETDSQYADTELLP